MATSDVTEFPTAPSAAATTTLAARTATTPPGQARPAHDDLAHDDLAPAQPTAAVPGQRTVLDQGLVEELGAAPAGAPDFERPSVAGHGALPETADEADPGRGTPLQALAGWGGALVLGATCWAGALAVIGRFV
ncbi:hypothetical protein [uncultured Pseudokineococcus sp.]|uniref:hypothetical protein n=1 Tax=uncultured Pseudokineococcus sp. TaxID=1642928 RepID=UPI0026028316|nr:hypothetical protein [uncultured Pseudokineococcus sp.]